LKLATGFQLCNFSLKLGCLSNYSLHLSPSLSCGCQKSFLFFIFGAGRTNAMEWMNGNSCNCLDLFFISEKSDGFKLYFSTFDVDEMMLQHL
jgi:hypothetical protein